jgi:pyocin large subunit-like protein
LTTKEEEIVNVKKKFKDEKLALESEKKRLNLVVEELKSKLENTESRYYAYKKEVDESPLSVMRSELAQKNVEIIELDNKLK